MASHIAAVFVLALAFLAAGIDTYAATLVVTKTADTADGICDSDCSLREAVTAAASGDTVVFSPLFNEPQTITLTSGQISITRGLTINGPGRDLLTISGNNASRIFSISGGAVASLSRLKLANGLAANAGAIGVVESSLDLLMVRIENNRANDPNFGSGGGILVNGGTLTLNNSAISNNTATSVGGGIRVINCALTVTDSYMSGNTGGGISGLGNTNITIDTSEFVGNSGPAVANNNAPTTVRNSILRSNGSGILGSVAFTTVDRSIISDNGAGVGSHGPVMISNSTIRNNNTPFQVGQRGAGLFITGGPSYVINTSIINNTAYEEGGGVYNIGAQLYLTNSTVSGNFARNGTGQNPCSGGGIHNAGGMGTVVLTNSTVANNRAQGRGGGICNDTGGTVITRNSIISGNMGSPAPDFYGVIASEGNNLIRNTDGNSGWIGSDLQNVDPMLAPLGNHGGSTWTHALLPKSPAIEAGNNALALSPNNGLPLTYDQRGPGFPRIVNGNVDIGSYEANYASAPVPVGGRVLVSPLGRGVASVRVTLTDTFGNVRYTQTNPSGYYRFFGLVPGMTYIVAVSHKSHQFDSPQFVTIDQPRDNLDFVALGH